MRDFQSSVIVITPRLGVSLDSRRLNFRVEKAAASRHRQVPALVMRVSRAQECDAKGGSVVEAGITSTILRALPTTRRVGHQRTTSECPDTLVARRVSPAVVRD